MIQYVSCHPKSVCSNISSGQNYAGGDDDEDEEMTDADDDEGEDGDDDDAELDE